MQPKTLANMHAYFPLTTFSQHNRLQKHRKTVFIPIDISEIEIPYISMPTTLARYGKKNNTSGILHAADVYNMLVHQCTCAVQHINTCAHVCTYQTILNSEFGSFYPWIQF
ncbi:hypothetical protein HELRODRAFT_168484 [Helobdella robusta]|uniref:Uncharacterized protein n=1 Tax=Helobdella robusta TaxID=6412 RepID=T1F0M3_HELRO|nr:hypothetical protein HELRODRAFT_168484 [Helobdella robusta]ESO09491.1 hypothetical protein HELRODRAFT_168484 [Helobdella robusta]